MKALIALIRNIIWGLRSGPCTFILMEDIDAERSEEND